MCYFHMDAPETLQQAISVFSDPDRAFEATAEFRWPGGNVACPRCGQAKHSFVKTRRTWFCFVCKKQFTVKVGTVMEDSPIGTDKWTTTMWMPANYMNGISSYELAKAIGVRQNTAWFMLHRIRMAMQRDNPIQMGGNEGGGWGIVQAEETFIGGKPKNMHASKRARVQKNGKRTDKPAVFGLRDRESQQVGAKIIRSVKR